MKTPKLEKEVIDIRCEGCGFQGSISVKGSTKPASNITQQLVTESRAHAANEGHVVHMDLSFVPQP
jgi:hypothetical protein